MDWGFNCVLIRGQEVIAVGKNLERDYHVVSLVEDSAKVALLSSLIKRGGN